jgi:hypothetical protein
MGKNARICKKMQKYARQQTGKKASPEKQKKRVKKNLRKFAKIVDSKKIICYNVGDGGKIQPAGCKA